MEKQSKIVSYSFASEGSEPVTLTQAKAHLYIDSSNTDFDAYLSTTDNLIKRCRQYVEEITGLALVDKTVTLYIDYESEFTLPFVFRGYTVAITSAHIKAGVNDYELQTINEDYELDGVRFISYIGNYRWKLVYTIVASVPDGLKMAILNEIAKRFEHRGDNVQVVDTTELINPYIQVEWLI